MDVIQRVKEGASLIVTNSTLSHSDQLLASLAVDPMRGRASYFWNGVMQELINCDLVDPTKSPGRCVRLGQER